MAKADKDTTKILSKNLFPVVGIGASAGGLEAFRKLIKAIPDDSGMAYILVQHLHPEHSSSLPDILQRETNIPVHEVKDNVEVKPDNVYIIPANKMLVATDGVLQLSPRPAKDQKNMPIDIFFSSLAEVHQSHAIGIVLSGTGADGTLGLKDIKSQGGITFAQEISSAAYEAMPQNAIDAEVVDFILSPEKMPQQLLELNRTFNRLPSQNHNATGQLTEEESFKKILSLLRTRHGVDFTYYKQTTIRRRILRRLVITKQENIIDYLEYLKQNNTELDIIFQDILIPVTSFFRDPPVFENLCENIFPELIKNKSHNNPLRIWIAACSTGEEAYSMAICLHEYLSDKTSNIKIQIFATDISEKAIAKARAGLYLKRELEGVSDARLHQFFTKTDGHYQVKKMIRDMCVFASHNFLKDPPFAKIDLISCRNVLIYMEPFLQQKAFTFFHYALNEKGYLLLGKSETTGSSSQLFNTVEKKEKLYSRKSVPGRFMNVASERSEEAIKDKDYGLRSNERRKDDFQKNADDILLSKYTPAGVIVNEQLDIVQFRGSTGEFLEPSPGKASLNVLKMAREGLSFELRNALYKSKTTNEPFIKEGIPINYGKKLVNIEVIPLLNTEDLHFLILFKEEASSKYQEAGGSGQSSVRSKSDKEKDSRIQQLEKNLLQAREDMHSITEDQEAANEELQSANEELLSGSEELQSLNEELETSKEELQSTNEELITVNQELYERNEQFNLARLYAEAIVTTIHEPLLVLGYDFTIKSANKAFYKTFQLTEEETVGKILFDLQNQGWNIPGVQDELLKIQKGSEKFLEWEITYTFPAVGERIICFNAQPFQKENGEHWILLALEDITEQVLASNKIEASEKRYRELILGSPVGIYTCNAEGGIELYNETAVKIWGRTPEAGKDKWCGSWKMRNADETLLPHDQCPMAIAVKEGRSVSPEIIIEQPDGTKHWAIPYPQAVYDSNGKLTGAINTIIDITPQVLARKQIEASEKRYDMMVMQSPFGFAVLKGKNMVVTLANDSIKEMWGKQKGVEGKPLIEVLPEIKGQGFPELLDNVYTTGKPYFAYETLVLLKRNGKMEDVYFNFIYQPYFEIDETISGVAIIAIEVTPQAELNKKIKASEERFRQLTELIPEKISNANTDGSVIYFNKNWLDYAGMNFEELRDFGYHQIMHPDEVAEFQKRLQEAAETGTGLEMEMRFMNKEGEYKWHLNRTIPVKDETGKVIMWIGATTDIQHQKLKEQAKDEFIGIASHEMKTPLTTAKAYLQLLQQGLSGSIPQNSTDNLLEEKAKESSLLLAQKANESIDRLNSLVGELLDVSKIQSGKLPLIISTFNFDEMIKQAIESVQFGSPNHHIIPSGETGGLITGDKDRLQQVVINLLSNAIKYSPQADKVFIKIVKQNNEIMVSVKDSGIGVKKESLQKIFKRYYREEGRAMQFQGLGIGLSISFEIIERHHGKIWAESEEGKGSTFYFTIPV